MDTQNQKPQDPIEPTNGQTPAGNPGLSNSPQQPAATPPAGQPAPTGQPAPAGHTAGPEPGPSPASPLGKIASGFSSVLGAIFSWIIFPIAVVLILHNFVFQAYHVLGTSMVPTLHETDYLIVSKLGYTQALVQRVFGQNKKYIPSRGEIIVFRYPKDPSKVFVKRVIGLPGERVVIKDGTVTVFNKENPNGFNPDKGYEKSDATTLGSTDETVQTGNLFVMGDNRTPSGSYDSREWGELPSSYIIGNAVLRLLPLDQVKFL